MSNLTALRINVDVSKYKSVSFSQKLLILQYNMHKSKNIVMAFCIRDTKVEKFDILAIQEL